LRFGAIGRIVEFEVAFDASAPSRAALGPRRSAAYEGRSAMTKKKRPAKGDFARGERKTPTPDEAPDFARGERKTPTPDEAPDFARGERKTDG
jgi:hypothetical protein